MREIIFNSSQPLTLGVELEFQILARDSLNLVPRAPALLAEVPAALDARIKPEFIQSMIEVNTRVCATMAEVAEDLTGICRTVEDLARQHDCLLYAASLHPFALSGEQLVSARPRYERFIDDLQLVGRRFITQGLHVHVGLPDGETAIRVFDNIRIYLPILLALTSSSPYFEGMDTGLCSYRAKLFEALPLAGMPDHLGNWTNFQEMATLLFKTEIIHEVRDLWWDVRPHPDFGTIEIRICDLPSRFDEILALTALIQALVATLARSPALGREPNMQILRSNKWQALRYGLAGRFIDPRGLTRLTMAEAARDLLEFVGPTVKALGSGNYLAVIDRILREGTSSDRQRQLYRACGCFTTVIEKLRREFWT